MFDTTAYIVTGIGLGVLVAVLLRPVLQRTQRPLSFWQENGLGLYALSVVVGALALTAWLHDAPRVGALIARNSSAFIILWSVPVWIMIVQFFRKRR